MTTRAWINKQVEFTLLQRSTNDIIQGFSAIITRLQLSPLAPEPTSKIAEALKPSQNRPSAAINSLTCSDCSKRSCKSRDVYDSACQYIERN